MLRELNIGESTARLFSKSLLKWYVSEGREFPWRATRDPYHILVAEILLQRTISKKVAEIFPLFIEAFPDLQTLARAPLCRIEQIIAPLGIAYRADRLKDIAQIIVADFRGRVPDDKNDLLKLPGVGDYTANAVLCFAYGYRLPIVDPTVVRVLGRVFDLSSEKVKPTTDKKFWLLAAELLPARRFRDYNFALLDLGASICTARNPKHDICPVSAVCRYYLSL